MQIPAMLDAAQAEQATATARIVETCSDPADLPILIAEDMHARLVDGCERSPERGQIECCAGCSFCCYMAVDVTAPEAIRIASHLRTTRTNDELVEIHRQLRANERRIRGLSFTEHVKSVIRCAFLDNDGNCSIYDIRPLNCVKFTSKSIRRCEAMYNNPTDISLSAPQDEHATVFASGIQLGLRDGLRSAGLNGSSYELHSAVLTVLDDECLPQRWATGEVSFRGAINRDPENIPADEHRELNQPPAPQIAVGRNAPCPCGSGKKFKRCCGRGR